MKKLFLSFVFCNTIIHVSAQIMWQFNKDTVVTWNYDWGDEFNGDQLDRERWSTGEDHWHTIFTNREQEYYTDNGENHILKDGTLKIIAKREKTEARAVGWMEDMDSLWDNKKFVGFNRRKFEFTSGKIDSKKSFNKGFFEIRFKAPPEKGMWPAFWLYGGDPNEEIDIFELKGERPSRIHVDTHCPNDCDVFKTWYGKKQDWGGWLTTQEKLTEGFNVMAGEWEDDFVKIFLNGKCIAYVPVRFNIPKTLEANLAIPADDGPFHPGPTKNFIQSSPFEIDYIRVWTKQSAPGAKMKNESVKTFLAQGKEGKAKLRRKDRFMYGDKSTHSNEGPIVSLFPGREKEYFLFISNLEEGKKVEAELIDETGSIINSAQYDNFQNTIDLSKIKKGTYTLKIKYDGRSRSVAVTL